MRAGGRPARQLRWTLRAARDLLFIERHYADFSQATADRVVAAIVAAAHPLERFPRIGVRGRRPATRHRVISEYPFTIIYRVRRTHVEVLRVLHQSRSYFN